MTLLNILNQIFLEVLNRGLAVTYVILAILFARLLLKRLPKKYSYALWSIAGLRLLFDFRLSSVISLFNYVSAPALTPRQIQTDYRFARLHAISQMAMSGEASPADTPAVASGALDNAVFFRQILSVFCLIWLSGILLLLVHAMISHRKVRKNVATAIKYENNIYQCSNLSSPFVIGLFSPKIYIPFHLDKSAEAYVLAHENCHIRRKDPWIRMLSFLLLIVFWFHPLLWYSYYLMIQDMEMSCDEAVLAHMGNENKQDYSNTLLAFAKGKQRMTIGPLSFGESHAGKRIKNVLRFKKPGLWIGITGILVIGIIAAICLTNADTSEEHTGDIAAQEADSLPTDINIAQIYTAVDAWAQAFVSRDGNTIARMSSDSVKDGLSLSESENGSYDFGWSSPWPWMEPSYTVLDVTLTGADILYYAYTSDPHVTVWTETLEFVQNADTIQITSEELVFHDSVSSGAEFAKAYPEGIDGSGMDYLNTGLGETLNQNAQLSSSDAYRHLFSPETALIYLLNLSTDPEEVLVEIMSDESVDGIQIFNASIHFLSDNITVNVSVQQPYGTSGIWIPQNSFLDPMARFMAIPWTDIQARNLSLTDNIISDDIICIGELPEEKIKIYGYNDEECHGRGVAVEIGEDVNYLDWYYTTPRALLPSFYWNDTDRQLQVSLRNDTGTGVNAEELHILQQYDTGALIDHVFDITQYSQLLTDRLTFEYNHETSRLTLFDVLHNKELAQIKLPAMEEDAVSLTVGDISHFELGTEITLHFTPGYCPDGWLIPQYDNMPTLQTPVTFSYDENDKLIFELGEFTITTAS